MSLFPSSKQEAWSAGRAPGAGEAPLGGMAHPARAPGEGARPPVLQAGCALPALHRAARIVGAPAMIRVPGALETAPGA